MGIFRPANRVVRMNDPFDHVASLSGVSEAVGSARDSIDRLLGHRILRRRGSEISAESALRGARASAALEGVSAPLDDVRAGTLTDPLVQGALRVSAELGSLTGPWRVAPRQALARLHALASSSGGSADDLGRPRADLRASDPLSLGPPPSPDEVSVRLSSLCDLLTSPTKAPALVVAAVVHGELLALRPFGRADGIVARAAVRLTFADRGLDPKSLATPEVGHVELGNAYGEALHAYVSGTPDGVAQWVRHCAEATTLGARDTLAVCESFTRS